MRQAFIKPNTDVARMTLKDVLGVASPLLDIMLIRPGGKWQFDLDQRLDLHLEASTKLRLSAITLSAKQLMPVHIAETLRELDLLGGGLELDGKAIDWTLASNHSRSTMCVSASPHMK